MTKAAVIADNDRREEAIISAISDVDEPALSRFGGWDELNVLSSATLFEGIEPAPGGVVLQPDGNFVAAATVYVTLQYGGSKDGASMSDAYPAVIRGRIDNELNVEIESIDVDTESFYAD
ncbi:MAG: hypothetical protein O9283_01905 [Sphingomonadaceae bacterium]|nr:hypothetical protein [Sphingomonadaceae bacterium]